MVESMYDILAWADTEWKMGFVVIGVVLFIVAFGTILGLLFPIRHKEVEEAEAIFAQTDRLICDELRARTVQLMDPGQTNALIVAYLKALDEDEVVDGYRIEQSHILQALQSASQYDRFKERLGDSEDILCALEEFEWPKGGTV